MFFQGSVGYFRGSEVLFRGPDGRFQRWEEPVRPPRGLAGAWEDDARASGATFSRHKKAVRQDGGGGRQSGENGAAGIAGVGNRWTEEPCITRKPLAKGGRPGQEIWRAHRLRFGGVFRCVAICRARASPARATGAVALQFSDFASPRSDRQRARQSQPSCIHSANQRWIFSALVAGRSREPAKALSQASARVALSRRARSRR